MSTRFEDFLQFAMENEREAAQLYETYAAKVAGAAQKQLLKELAATERQHEAKLKRFAAGNHKALGSALERSDIRISDFLVDVRLTEDSSLQDVLIFAMKAEQRAFQLYEKLGALEGEPESRELFTLLAAEEKKHKLDLESAFEDAMLSEF